MPPRRPYASYNDGCAAAHALDLVGDRWALLVARELLLGPKRFSDLQRDVSGISATALTQRLRDLEREGVLEQEALPAPARVPVYRLTPWGRELEDVVTALSLWGSRSRSLPRDVDMSPDTVVLAMRAHARPAPDLRVALRLTDARYGDAPAAAYTAVLGQAASTVVKAGGEGADVTVDTDTRTWRRLLFGETDVAGEVRAGRLVLSPGSGTAAVEALLRACSPA